MWLCRYMPLFINLSNFKQPNDFQSVSQNVFQNISISHAVFLCVTVVLFTRARSAYLMTAPKWFTNHYHTALSSKVKCHVCSFIVRLSKELSTWTYWDKVILRLHYTEGQRNYKLVVFIFNKNCCMSVHD